MKNAESGVKLVRRRLAIWLDILALTVVIILWQYGSWIIVPTYIFPTPYSIASVFIHSKIPWVQHILVTLYEVVTGFAAAIVFGIGIALLMSSFSLFRQVLSPYILILQVVPKVALAPILIVTIGYGLTSKVVITFLVAFFPVIINTLAGLISVPQETLDVVRTLKARPLQIFTKVTFPAALPYIFAGLEISSTLAVVGAVVGEFTGSGEGLGYILLVATTVSDAATSFAALLLLSLMGIGLFFLIVALERVLMPWNTKSRELRGGQGA